jgi:hypothetical protein
MDEAHTDRPSREDHASFREIATNAIRYWEFRRFLYNAVLAFIVFGYFCAASPKSRAALDVDRLLGLFVLAVLANLCYCAAYIVDIFAQFSGFRTAWLRWRWLLLTLGVIFAGVITRFFAIGFFAPR